ncbi:hypothetical protein EMCRGX_G012325 [Ephydatia muelleri]
MLGREVIQPSNSPWASPVVLAQKKDGINRFCVDYRKLNVVTRKDAYPLPRIDETLEALGGSRWFSTLDLLTGYWQVEAKEEDRPKTAFSTRDGLYEFKVMPFVKELQKFLGLAGYYRRYVKDFASLAQPLFRLMERGREFKWTQECSEAFAILKLRLTSAPILAFPDFKAVIVLDTDVSESGIGAVLSQVDKDGFVAYASRVLNKAERKYSILPTRKALYPQDRPQLIEMAAHFQGAGGANCKMVRKVDFEVVHRSGRNHGNADALSRSRLPPEQDVNVNTLLGLVVSERSIYTTASAPGQEYIGPVYQAMQDGSKPGPETTQGGSRELLQLIEQWDQLTLKDGVLYRQHEDAKGHMKFQVILPEGSAKATPSTVDQLPAGTNLKFIESEEDMAVDVPQETDVADRGRRADGEPQLHGRCNEAVPHEEPQLLEDRIPGPVEIVPDRSRAKDTRTREILRAEVIVAKQNVDQPHFTLKPGAQVSCTDTGKPQKCPGQGHNLRNVNGTSVIYRFQSLYSIIYDASE